MRGLPVVMRKVILPKNKGRMRISWGAKRPVYVVAAKDFWRGDSWGVSKKAYFELFKKYNGKVTYICKVFPTINEKNLDRCLQQIYENLMIFHGLLSFSGVLCISADWITLDYIRLLVTEIFGEGDMRIKYIEEGRF